MGNVEYKHIFIVDDDKMFATMVKDHLNSAWPNLKISVFHTGEECKKNLFRNPDVIILDYYLNTVFKDAADGLEILSEIKKHNEHIHVIMLSSQARYGIALQTISKGAEQYVIKDEKAFKKIDEALKDMI